mmetsp:Transcript_9377/g.16114  ORF Transcript_9377/g.16114 Transcript_9377/m.16114 type:complete len:232 (-) Transcript_9377:39-734(-)
MRVAWRTASRGSAVCSANSTSTRTRPAPAAWMPRTRSSPPDSGFGPSPTREGPSTSAQPATFAHAFKCVSLTGLQRPLPTLLSPPSPHQSPRSLQVPGLALFASFCNSVSARCTTCLISSTQACAKRSLMDCGIGTWVSKSSCTRCLRTDVLPVPEGSYAPCHRVCGCFHSRALLISVSSSFTSCLSRSMIAAFSSAVIFLCSGSHRSGTSRNLDSTFRVRLMRVSIGLNQ